jgi:hypothetical protein
MQLNDDGTYVLLLILFLLSQILIDFNQQKNSINNTVTITLYNWIRSTRTRSHLGTTYKNRMTVTNLHFNVALECQSAINRTKITLQDLTVQN